MKKFILVSLSLITTVYSLWYASLGGFAGNSGALSKIGLEHPILFAVWGILTYVTLAFGIIIGLKNVKYKLFIILLMIALIGMGLTLCFDFDYDKHTQYMLHCIGSLTFSAVMGITVFLLFLISKSYYLAAVSGIILITDVVFLIIFKETAVIELAPIFSGYIMLCIHNLRKEKEHIEIK